MVKILKLKRKGGYQHYTVTSKEGYRNIGTQKGETVYAKVVKKEVGISETPTIDDEPLSADTVKVKVFLKEDYGKVGHPIWFDCWVSRVFYSDSYDAINIWIDETKEYLRDKITGYGEMFLLSGFIYGTEIDNEKEPTKDSVGTQEEHFEYSHNNKTWFKIP